MSKRFKIGDKTVGAESPCYIIAEMSCNHENSFEEACRILEAAASAGADALKIQTYTADTITRDFKNDCGKTMWGESDLYKLYDKAHTPWDWFEKLSALGKQHGIDVLSSVFDETSVDYLVERNISAFKVSSFEIVDTKLLEKVALTGKPVIISTGMASFQEIIEAESVLKKFGCTNYAVLHCNSGYPPPFTQANLNTIPVMDSLFEGVIGLSDHTLFADIEKFEIPLAHVCPLEAVKLGAKIIEVHLLMDRQKSRTLFESGEGGYDWAFSREPAELRKTIDMIRKYESGQTVAYQSEAEHVAAGQARGEVCFEPTEKERASRVFRPVLWLVEDVKKGEKFKFSAGKSGNFDSIRGKNSELSGLHVRFADYIERCAASDNFKAGQVLSWDMISPPNEAGK